MYCEDQALHFTFNKWRLLQRVKKDEYTEFLRKSYRVIGHHGLKALIRTAPGTIVRLELPYHSSIICRASTFRPATPLSFVQTL